MFTEHFNVVLFAEFGGFGSVSGKIEIEIKINHEGEVNRYRLNKLSTKVVVQCFGVCDTVALVTFKSYT